MADIKSKTFNYLAWFTGIVVLIFLVTLSIGALMGKVAFKDYVGYISTPVAMLITMWARDIASVLSVGSGSSSSGSSSSTGTTTGS